MLRILLFSAFFISFHSALSASEFVVETPKWVYIGKYIQPFIFREVQFVEAYYPPLGKILADNIQKWKYDDSDNVGILKATREGDRNNANLIPLIDGTNDGSYYRIWRAIDNGDGKYSQLSVNKLSELINFENDEDYLDIYSQEDNVTLYYLLESVDSNGNSTLYCSEIQATVLGQGPSIDLEAAKKYCRNQCSYGINCK